MKTEELVLGTVCFVTLLGLLGQLFRLVARGRSVTAVTDASSVYQDL
jgi:hypothetical protein